MKLKNTFDLVNGMSSIVRYSQSTLCKPESVLEHTGFVAVLSLIIGKGLKDRGTKINIEVLLTKALVHDMDEVVTGDIPRPTKYHNEKIKSELDLLSFDAMESICEKLNLDLISDWDNAKKDTEGGIVELVDSLAVIWKAHDEIVMRGNKMIQFGGIEPLLKRTSLKCHELANETGQHEYFANLLDEAIVLSNQISEIMK